MYIFLFVSTWKDLDRMMGFSVDHCTQAAVVYTLAKQG
jgi:hypothetical protein